MKMSVLVVGTVTTLMVGTAHSADTPHVAELAWGVEKHGLVLRIAVDHAILKPNQRPNCAMEICNVTSSTMLVEDRISPEVYDDRGRPCRPWIDVVLPAEHKWKHHVLQPSACVTVEAKPNCILDQPGTYTLYFGLYPAVFGHPKGDDLNVMVPAGTWTASVVSNRLTLEIVTEEPGDHK